MTYNEWRDELKSNLLCVSEPERRRVLDYYAEAYADRRDAGFSEREIIQDFGAPYDAAQRILNEKIDDEFKSDVTAEEKPTEIQQTDRKNEKLKKDIARLTESAKRISDWSDKTEASKFKQNSSGLKNDRGYIGHKSAKMMKRAKATENRKQQAIIQKSELLKNTENADGITISPLKHHSSRLLTLSDVAVFYGDRKICSGVSFEVEQGDRIALDGKNGSGKSSILKLIWGGGHRSYRHGELGVGAYHILCAAIRGRTERHAVAVCRGYACRRELV